MTSCTLEKSPYSRHFNHLTIVGAWAVKHQHQVFLYSIYKTLMTVVAFLGVFSLAQDLYFVYGNFKKVTWNLCITALFAGGLTKNIYNYINHSKIDKLRMRLHIDLVSRNNPEDIEIHKWALKRFKNLDLSIYSVTAISVSTWLVTKYISYIWGPRELPIPLRVPFEIDLTDNIIYTCAFIVFGCGGLTGLFLVLETELAMFSLLVQIWREYKIFLNDISKLNDSYDDSRSLDEHDLHQNQLNTVKHEINPLLRNIKTKLLLKKLLKRQEELIEYTKVFEKCYNGLLLIQFFVSTLLVVVSCIQCILESDDLSINISYQLGYLCLLLFDMFLASWFATEINTSCLEVGEAAYSTYWYSMNTDIQKDIMMMILRSQRPPKLTFGKFIEMNLHAFMLMMRNIYSCLTLFLQLEFKTSE